MNYGAYKLGNAIADWTDRMGIPWWSVVIVGFILYIGLGLLQDK